MHRSICLLLVLLSILSCKEKKEGYTVHSPEVQESLLAVTRGMLAENGNIVFQFKKNIGLDPSKLEGAVTIEPDVPIKVSIDSMSNRIIVNPQQNLERGGDYRVTLDLPRFVPSAKEGVTTEIKVHNQYISVVRKGIFIDNDAKKYVELLVTTSIPEPRERLTQLFDPSVGEVDIIKTPQASEYIARIAIDPKEKKPTIAWDGKPLQSEESGKVRFWSSDLEGCKVITTYYDRRNQELTAYFSQLLDEKQDAKGLVLAGDRPAQYKIENNQIKVYIKSSVSENQNIRFLEGIRSREGKKLEKEYVYEVEIRMVRPEVQWMQEGVYIPQEGRFHVPFKAKGLQKLRVSVAAIREEHAAQFVAWNSVKNQSREELVRYGEYVYEDIIDLNENKDLDLTTWNEYGINLTKAFARESGVIYRVNLDFLPSYTILECKDKRLATFEQKHMDQSWFDSRDRIYDYYDYYYDGNSNNPCNASYYYNRSTSKNILCTNVFPIIKKTGQGLTVAVKELLTSSLAVGAEIQLLSLQGKTIATQTLGTTGVATFGQLKREVAALRVRYNSNASFFNITNDPENSITEFDVSSGVQDAENRIYVYGERDVWRPSDTVYINVMLNRPDFEYPEGAPVVVDIYNPKNVHITRMTDNIRSDKALYSFSLPTSLDDLTGTWQAKVRVGPHTKNHNLRIETIRPNVVDLVYSFGDQDEDWVYSQTLKGKVQVDYLAGYAVKGGKVTASANIYPMDAPFKRYTGYRFAPYDLQSSKDVSLFSQGTDNTGSSSVQAPTQFRDYRAVSRVIVDTKVDLPGGGSNTMTQGYYVSPYQRYVGIEMARGRGWRGSYHYGEKPTMDLLHLDARGRLVKGKTTADAILFKANKDWWYDRYALSPEHRVQVGEHYTEVSRQKITFVDGKAGYKHEAYDSGLFVLRIVDKESGHTSEYRYHSVNSNDYSVRNNPVFFQLDMEKNEYKVGEEMRIGLPQIEGAKAYVSIEKGDKVLESFWIDTDKPELALTVKESWYPNFYIHTSIVQPYEKTSNDRPMRMYTVEKVTVTERRDILEPIIDVAEKVLPNEAMTIQVSEKSGKAMEYTLAVVDRGLHNITGFRTPDPIKYFSQQFSLLVRTWDIYMSLIHFMDPNYAGVFSIGGDGMLKKIDEAADFNRFEPVAFHLGPFRLEPNAKKTHKINIPNYIGNLKVSVVAVGAESFGSAEKDVRVASPLMIQSQLPRALNVSDKVTLPIAVFKDEESIQSASIKVKSDEKMIAFEKADVTVPLADEKQGIGLMHMLVQDHVGTTDLSIEASGGGYKASEETKIFVNYPNSYEDRSSYIEVPPMTSESIDITSFGYSQTKNVDLAISGIILPPFVEYYNSLLRYPYGCLEQTASKGIVLLHTPDFVELSGTEKHDAKDHLDAALNKIYSYQKGNGSFKYWPSGYYHEWGDLYAGHFLIEAREKGIQVNQDVLNKWIAFTTNRANRWKADGLEKRTMEREQEVQAYRLMVLARANNPAKSAMNRMRSGTIHTQFTKVLLGGAYTYANMKDIGSKLFFEGLSGEDGFRYHYRTFGTPTRNKAITLMILAEIEQGDRVDRFYRDWVRSMNNRWMSTQEKGFALMACKSYFGKGLVKSNQELDVEISSTLHNKREKIRTNSISQYHWGADAIADKAIIENKGQGSIFVIKNERAVPTDLYRAAASNSLGMKVRYTYLDGSTVDLSDMKQGEELRIQVTLTNKDLIDHRSLALALKMPSGWEILNPRLYKTAATKGETYNYQDYRDDKVYTFFSLPKGKSTTFSFRAKANLKGDYYLPAVTCEHMYQGEVNARTQARRVVIH